MRRKYVPPNIEFINLSVNQMICSSCTVEATLAEYVCTVEIPGLGFIFSDGGICEFMNDVDICYHTPTPNSNVFSS